MIPGFSAENTVYQSRPFHAGGPAFGTPAMQLAATNYCISGNGRLQCGTASGIGEGLLWGGLIGGVFGGGLGAAIGAAIGAAFCWLVGCD